MWTYRGYDIVKEVNKFFVEVNGKRVDGGGGGFSSLTAAENAIDARRRSRVAAGLDPVSD